MERFQPSIQSDRVPEQRLVKKLTTNGSDEPLDERMQAARIKSSIYNLQFGQHRLIQ